MKIIVGLGNPGDKYNKVRHNLGFMVVDELVKKLDGGRLKIDIAEGGWKMEEKFKAAVIKIGDLLLAKPQTFMNNSGLAVKLLTTYYKLPTTGVIIIHDELDLPLGKIKVRMGGAAAGHHGVESIIEALGTDEFIRVRLGIGNLRSRSGERKGTHFNAEHFILESFMPNERSQVKHMIKQAVGALETVLDKGLESAQNQFN